jgi:hypothetical protein
VALVDSFRRFSVDEIAQLLAERPELAVPPPGSLEELAARAASPYALQSAFARLDRGSLGVLEAIAFLGGDANPSSIARVPEERVDPDGLRDVLGRLHTLGLIEIAGDRFVLQPAVARALGAPFGLRSPLERALDRLSKADLGEIAMAIGVPAVVGKVGQVRLIADDLRSPNRIDGLINRAGDDARAILDAIEEAGGLVPLPTHRFVRSQLPPPILHLLNWGLLIPYGGDLLEIPREVALVLRGGWPTKTLELTAPVVTLADASNPDDRLAGPREMSPPEVTQRVTAIVSRLTEQPIAGLKSSGVAVKDVKAIAKDLHVEEMTAARLLELARVAGLIAGSYGGPVQATSASSAWLNRPAYERWSHLVRAWSWSGIELGRAGTRDHNDKPIAPLSDVGVSTAIAVRRRAKLVAAIVGYSDKLGGEISLDSLIANLSYGGVGDWLAGDDEFSPIVRMVWTVDEMGLLGLLRGGVPTPVLKQLAMGRPSWETISATALELFPSSIQTFTVQADLTAIVPAELEPAVAAELELLTEGMSRSAVSVMRFTETALRNALDRGRTAEGIIEFLRAHAKPSVPQSLEVLVADVARRHGRVRIGRAASYLRTEDEALLAEISRHRKLAKIGLRVIAPTVAVSDTLPPKLLAAVRDAGFLPVIDGDGVEVKVAPISDRHLRLLTPTKDADRAWAEGVETGDPAGGRAVTPSAIHKELARRLKR